MGTAAWADIDDVERHEYRPGKLWLGRSARGVPIGYSDDRHVMVVSGTRGGKGTSFIVTNLCLWPGSIVVIDPKGENATVTATRRGRGSEDCEGMGQDVHILDPFREAKVDAPYRSRFNPLDVLDPGDPQAVDQAARLADALVVVREDAKEPFWDLQARDMVKALLLHVRTARHYEGRRHLGTVRQLLLRGEWELSNAIRESGETDIPRPQKVLWMEVAKNSAFGGVLNALGDKFVNLLDDDARQFQGVLQSAQTSTDFLDSKGMVECVSASDFKLSDLKSKAQGVSLYLCLPGRYMNTHFRWLRMMTSLLVTEMEAVKGRPASGHRVLFLLDEFAGLQRMPVIENAVAQIAGAGVKMCFILQSLAQLKNTYKENWETFVANCGLKIFFSLGDHGSAEYASKLIGEMEVVRKGRTENQSYQESEGLNEGGSKNRGTSESNSDGVSYGTNESWTKGASLSRGTSMQSSYGGGSSMSWQPGGLAGPRNRHYSQGQHWSASASETTTSTTSNSHTTGRTDTSTINRTKGTSESEGSTWGKNSGTSEGWSGGTSESVHRHPLVAPDEILQTFAFIESKSDPRYPGLALVLMGSERPFPVRRTNYYQDYQFIGLFDAHPDHPGSALRRTRFDRWRLKCLSESLEGLAWTQTVSPGELVETGQEIARVRSVSGLSAAIRAPRRGRIERMPAPPERAWARMGGSVFWQDDTNPLLLEKMMNARVPVSRMNPSDLDALKTSPPNARWLSLTLSDSLVDMSPPSPTWETWKQELGKRASAAAAFLPVPVLGHRIVHYDDGLEAVDPYAELVAAIERQEEARRAAEEARRRAEAALRAAEARRREALAAQVAAAEAARREQEEAERHRQRMMRQFEDECVIARGIAALASGLLAGGLVVAWLLTSILLSALSLLLVIPLIACLRRQALAQRQNDRIRRGWTPPRIKITGVYRD